MATWLVLPTMLTVASIFGAAWLQRRLRPDWAAWTLTVLSALAAIAVLWALTVVALGFVIEQPRLAGAFGWCSALLSTHSHVPMPFGVAAWLLLLGSGVSVALRLRTWRAAVQMSHADVAESNAPVAFAVPGRPGRIVVSEGMLATLDRTEQRVLYAHENSHLRRNHHRFLRVTDLATAAVPLLHPLNRLVRFQTERWADEDAAAEVGDRRLAARAIARAAVAASTADAPDRALAINGAGTRARVEALMQPPVAFSATTLVWIVLAASGLMVSLAASTVQAHQVMAFLTHICGPD